MDINELINQIEKEKSINKKIYLYKKAVEEHPDHIKLKYYYANALIAKNSLENKEELNQLFDDLINQNLKPVTRLYSLIHKAEFLMNTQNYIEARTILYRVILDDEDFFSDLALYYLGVLELKVNDYEKAKKIFNQCIAGNPNKIVSKSYLYLIDIATEEKNYEQALKYIHETETKTGINNETILIKKARVYRLQKRFDEARACLDTIHISDKSYKKSVSKLERARLYADEGKYDQARMIYNGLNQTGYLIDQLDCYYELRILEEKTHNYSQARQNFNQMLKVKEKIKNTYIKY